MHDMDVACKAVRKDLGTRDVLPRGGDLTWAEVHRALVPLMRADTLASVRAIAREYLCVASAVAAGAWVIAVGGAGTLSAPMIVALVIMLVAVVAAVQHRMAALAHEASHFVLYRHPLVNELVSDLLLLFPMMALTQRYRAAHFGHHRFVNDPKRDPDWIRLASYEPMEFPIAKERFWMRYVLRGLWPPAILGYLLGRAKAANLTDTGGGAEPVRAVYRASVAKRMRGAYWLALLSAVHATGGWSVFLLFWVVPLLTFYPLFMLLREIAHHANAPDDGPLSNSRLFDVHPLLAWAVFPYGQDLHLTHHLFAMIPHSRIRRAHAILSRHRPYRESVVVCQGYFFRRRGTTGPSVLELLSASAQREAVAAAPARTTWRSGLSR
jgi:fatty acid desaturase